MTSAVFRAPAPPARVHFVGIGGIGVSGLARIFAARGYRVTGSDANSSAMTAALVAEGIPVVIGHDDVAYAEQADLVVATAAADWTNPELMAAVAAGVSVVKRAVALGALANARTCIAVAGSHGKSSTSGMIATAMLALGMAPTYAVGAVLAATGTNAAPGDGAAMVVEADEFDRSFLTLTPDIAVVTNVEFDHPDIYADQDAYDDAFAAFVERLRPSGTLILCADDPGCRRVLERPGWRWPDRVVWYGAGEGAEWRVVAEGDNAELRNLSGQSWPLKVQVPGLHNLLNGAAAVLAVVAAGATVPDAVRAVGTYAGVGRRFEVVGQSSTDVVVVDDYAHHPTELRATLLGARQRYGGRRIWAVFQPHTYSRTLALLAEWPPALSLADQVVLLDVYGSRETDDLGVSSDDIARRMVVPPLRVRTPAEAAQLVAGLVQPGDVVLTLGAGDVTAAGPEILRLLETGVAR